MVPIAVVTSRTIDQSNALTGDRSYLIQPTCSTTRVVTAAPSDVMFANVVGKQHGTVAFRASPVAVAANG